MRSSICHGRPVSASSPPVENVSHVVSTYGWSRTCWTRRPRRPATERMEPVTPDMIPSSRTSAPRAAVPMQVDAPARPDPSLHQTLLSKNHQTEFISE